MMWNNRWWRTRRMLALILLTLTLAACGQPLGSSGPSAVPTMTPTPGASPEVSLGATPALNQATPASSNQVNASPTSTAVVQAPLDSKGFAAPAFATLWNRSDAAVASGKVSRTWLWGNPIPFGALMEPYAQAAGGSRLVQYFDKGRMEINFPNADAKSDWYVTSGLLTTELVTGKMQVGNHEFEQRQPAQIPVAGDLENISPQTPLFADYTAHYLAPAKQQTGQNVDTEFRRDTGEVEIDAPAPVKDAMYDATTGHNIPDVFTTYFDQELTKMGQNWLFVMGHPISEPYWVSARINGKTQLILVQLFERRAITYNPSNEAGWKVEFANIGLDYYRWRYHE